MRAPVRIALAAIALGVLAARPGASFAADPAHGFAAEPGALPVPPAEVSLLALPVPEITAKAPADASSGPGGMAHVLDAGRAQILLRSLTVPGWGQATLGAKRSATTFLLLDLGIWTAFTAFRIQEGMRQSSSETTAGLLAGIDLDGRDEEFRRTVGAYISSDEYNQLVVYRDAANLYYDNPAAYWAYIEAHKLTGDDTWKWQDEASLVRYQDQRKDAQRAAQRANTCLALAVANRLVSAVHAARLAGKMQKEQAMSWGFELVPVTDADPTACRAGVRARF